MRIRGAFVQVPLAARSSIPIWTCTLSRTLTDTTIKTTLITDRLTRVPVAAVAGLANAVVTTKGVHAFSVHVATVLAGTALVYFGAVELIYPPVAR